MRHQMFLRPWILIEESSTDWQFVFFEKKLTSGPIHEVNCLVIGGTDESETVISMETNGLPTVYRGITS